MAEKEIVVLAYSGGLDTSCAIRWLQDEKNLDVVAVVGEVGQEHEGLEKVKQRALDMGALDCYVIDMREDFADNIVAKAIKANGLYENKYPLLSALSRPVISKYLVQIAHKHHAKYIAHGCTGKGNDQVRFETCISMLDPSIEIIACVREWPFKARTAEMDWAAEHGVPVPTTRKSPYSIDDNLVGRAIECGVLEDPWNEPPSDIYTLTVDPEKAPDVPTYVDIDFEQGKPVALDGQKMEMKPLLEKIGKLAGDNGCGRLDMIENRLVGVKSREVYECPSCIALIVAHKALEDLCLERELLHYKLGLEQKWATIVYDGLWYGPLKEAIDAFVASTQTYVTGTVRMKLYKGNCTVVGLKSPYSLYDYGLVTYEEDDTFHHEAAAGFIELHGLTASNWAAKRLAAGAKEGGHVPAIFTDCE